VPETVAFLPLPEASATVVPEDGSHATTARPAGGIAQGGRPTAVELDVVHHERDRVQLLADEFDGLV
jgi:hypothetical protein